MIHPRTPTRKAISTLLMAIAFLVFSCHPRPPVPEPLEAEPDLELFSFAETELLEGRMHTAMEAFGEYAEKNPGTPKARESLQRIARIHERAGEYERALSVYQRILREFPDHPELAEVSLDKAGILYRLGRYEASRDETLQWLDQFAAHPLAGHTLLLLGKAAGALGDETTAFWAYIRASLAFPPDDPLQYNVDLYMAALLERAALDSLRSAAVAAPPNTRYLSEIYHRIARLALKADDLELAQEAAMALVRSTPEQYWVDRGREILDRITEELAVGRGVFACLLPLSGPFAIYGQEVLNGMQLGMGIFGPSEEGETIELLIEDTRGDPDVAAEKVKALVHEGRVMGIIGPLASRTATAAAAKAQELGVPIITLAQKEGITEEGDMVFRNFLTPAGEMDRLVSKAVRELGLVRFGILYPDSAYGRRLMNLFWDRVEEGEAFVTAVESYGPEVTDFSEPIRKMVGLHHPRPPRLVESLMEAERAAFDAGIESGAYDAAKDPEPIVEFDAVFIPDGFQKVALIAPQFPFHDVFNIRFLGTSLWQSPELLEQGADYLQGALFPTGFFAGAEDTFFELYRENFDSDPSLLAAIGYDTVRYLNHLMQTHAPKTRRSLQQALLLHRDFQGLRGALSFDAHREATTPAVLLTIRGKRFVPLN